MIVSRNIAASLSGGRFALDVPVAALAGLSVAFLVFAMPGDTLAELVGSTGLPSLLSAAEPPLGLKARIGMGAVGALAVFAAAFLMLRWLDRLGTRSEEDDRPETDAPRMRRRDFHPDAPPRPPIMATHEFGEPDYARPVAAELSEPETFEAPEAFEAPDAQDEWLLDEPVKFSEPATEPPPQSVDLADPIAAAPRTPTPTPNSTHARAPAPVPVPAPAPAPAELSAAPGSLDELMVRLEQGLARRRVDAPVPAEPPARHSPAPFPEAADDRLQSAIDNLQRLAGRGD